VRDAINSEDVVTARLRAVLPVAAQRPSSFDGHVADGGPPSWPDLAAQRPSSFDGHVADGGPPSWPDLVPSWPDDVDLDRSDPLDSDSSGLAASSSAPSGSPGVVTSSAPKSPSAASRDRARGSAWSSPPHASDPPAHGESVSSASLESTAEWSSEAAASGDGTSDQWPRPGAALTGAGAFDSRAARLSVFDPGRRGVKALAAVAVVVVLIAAVLAWRARPRVDPVSVPPVDLQAAAAPGGLAGGVARADHPAATGIPSAGAEVVVAVGGKVRRPGLVRLPPGSRVADALQAAGGANPGVDVALLNLARKVVDGELILVGVTPPPGVATGAANAPAGGAPVGGPVNLNTATLADLDTLPGVGPVLAQRILDAREAQGGFKAVSDLRKVDGIGDSRYEQLKDLVIV
jgi:competence protein ComEA